MQNVFQFQTNKPVRVEYKKGEVLFCLNDVADVLEIQNARQLNLKESGVEKISLVSGGQTRELTFINEHNLYRVIFRSNKPEAVKFQDWIFEEVIPAIRKTGSYSNPAAHRTLNEWEQHQIQVAVKQRSARTGETTQAVYAKLHAYMQCSSYLHICQADFQTALNFLASIQDAPELFRQPEIQGIVLTEEEIATIAVLTQYAQRMNLFCEDLAPRLRAIQSPMAAEAYSWREMPRGWICKSRRALMRAFPHMQQTQHIDTVRVAFSKMS